MDIEIITTKKKLTKSLISQMPYANIDDLEVLVSNPNLIYGYVLLNNTEILIGSNTKDYVRLDISVKWKAATHSPLECVCKNRFMRFVDQDTRDTFIKLFNQILELDNTKLHIYI